MADNQRSAGGFRWRSALQGNGRPRTFKKRVASAYQASVNPGSVSCDLFPGDPVKLVNDGTIALAAAGDSIWGVIAGIVQWWDGYVLQFTDRIPGGTTYGTVLERASIVEVYPVAGQIFEIDCDDAVTATTEAGYTAYIGENCDHVFAPVAADRKANPLLDISTHVATTAQWRIEDLSRQVNADYSGAYVKLLVSANEVQQPPYVTAGV